MKEKSNFNQAMWLGIGQLCTFAIAFITAPILSRYFDKVEYGTYRQILYVYISLQSLFTMGLPNVFAYFIPRLNVGQQKILINRLTLIFLVLGGLFSLVLFLSAEMIGELLNNPELSVGIRLFSLFPLFTLPAMGVEGIYTAIRRAKEIAIYHIFSKIMMFLCIVLPVIIWHVGYRGAIIGWGIASFITFIIAMYMKKRPYVKVDVEKIPNMYREIFSYSFPLTGAFIAGFFVNSADQFFVSRYYGTQVFAEFSNGCFSIPIVGMIAVSVKSVLLPLFSKADATHTLDSAVVSYNNAVKKTTTIVMPVLLFCVFFADDCVVALFGKEYLNSQYYLRMYIIRDFLQIFPYFAVLMALGYSKFYMNMHILGAILLWILDFIIVNVCGTASIIVLVSSLFHVLCSLAAFIFIYRKTRISLLPVNLQKYIGKLLLHCCICLTILFFVRNMKWMQCNVFMLLIVLGSLYYTMIIISGKFLSINYLESIQMLRKVRRNG